MFSYTVKIYREWDIILIWLIDDGVWVNNLRMEKLHNILYIHVSIHYRITHQLLIHRGFKSHSQEKDDTSVGHGIGQSQNATSHDGIAEVKYRHSKGGLSFKLTEKNRYQWKSKRKKASRKQKNLISSLTSVNWGCFPPSLLCGKNSSRSVDSLCISESKQKVI